MTGARDLPVLPRPGCTFADHSYPAFTAGQMQAYAEAALSKLQAENDKLRAGYAEAIDDIESWGAYAPEYYQKKWRLEACLAKHRETLGIEAGDDGEAT